MKVLIKVTKEILQSSMYCSGKYVGMNCAVALAVREIFPNAWVSNDTIHVVDDNISPYLFAHTTVKKLKESGILLYSIEMPEEAIEFIEEFDNSEFTDRILMEPISFEIDVPNEVIERIGITEVYKILSESKTLELVSI